MDEENKTTAVATVLPQPVQENIEVSAESPPDMEVAQGLLVGWARNKVAKVEAEQAELRSACDHAKKCKWKYDVLEKHANAALKRLEFYRKILAALEAGYAIVPPFPVDIFAIRTKTKRPSQILVRDRCEGEPYLTQHAQVLPAGEGQYQNPFPVLDWNHVEPRKDSQGNAIDRRKWFARAWDEMDFPLSMSKLKIMEATTRAMALHIFDEFGIFEKGSDPMILGSVILRQGARWQQKVVTFMIAWHLDTRTI